MNAVEIEEAITDLVGQEQGFQPEEFPFAFLEAFGNKTATIDRLRKGSANTSDISGGILQRNNIHVAVCKEGGVSDTFAALKASSATVKGKVKFIFATDGVEVEAEDMNSGETVVCAYADFPNKFAFFLPLAGITAIKQIKENSFDIRATSRLNRLYVELLKDNPDWATAERRSDMNHFMARLIFCFFAEDTDIFHGNNLFTETINQMSERDASNTHEVMGELFRAMDTAIKDRASANIKSWADKFPYVNGGLFAGSTEVPRFSKIARSYLLHIGSLDWKQINPDIFGSMIQAVADEEERGALGMHYTSVPNILKVLNPLFLDDLREQLEAAGDSAQKLLNIRKRMAKMRVFDPACGSGNFLVIAYKQMREIEAEINRRRGESGAKSAIPLTNFRGIEIRDFSAEIARLALIIAEYQCDVLYRGQKEALMEFLPLGSDNWITSGNALRIDWLSVCPPTGKGVTLQGDDLFETPLDQSAIDFKNDGGETYICGNPPYLGSKKKNSDQVRDMEAVGLGKAKLLDYVAAFMVKAAEYVRMEGGGFAIVATSSVCQGEQVSLIWPKILDGLEIKFGYQPFRWSNLATDSAGVWCTVIGVSKPDSQHKRLFLKGMQQKCRSISPYLIAAEPIYVTPAKSPISIISEIVMGSNPVDGKRLIFDQKEYEEIIEGYPQALSFFRKYGGTQEIVAGTHRYCLWIADHDVERAKEIPPISAAIKNCYEYRLTAGQDARRVAKFPHRFSRSTYKEKRAIHVGKVIGSKFSYVPAMLREPGYVSSDAAFTIYEPEGYEFAILVSTLHRVWAECVGGRLGDGVRYGATVVYNTFPIPPLTNKNRLDLAQCADNIILGRELHFPATIAELYDPENMPDNIRDAHDRNDEVLERIYIGRRFKNDTERLEKLFELYTKLTTKVAN
ncbi:lactate dehydrogenase [Rhodospirillales bacterium]|nr:lactate dehydrogenase [Rhodospirillales bacterium]